MAWRPSVRSDAFDVALAVVLGGLAGLSLYVGGDPFLTAPELADYSRPWGIACLSVMHLALAVRRRYPLAVAVVVTAAFLPVRFLDVSEFQVVSVSLFIAIYSAGAYGGLRRHAVRGVIAVAIGVLVVWTVLRDPLEPYEGRIPLELLNAFTAAVNVFYVAAAWMLGDVVRTRREREAQLETQAVVLEEAHEERARRAVLAERIRIARELHDVVAHHVSVMGVQAGAARRVLDRRPDAVPELLGSIEDASRHAVDELHRLLGFLRSDDEVDGTGPQPSLARLDELLRQMRDAGLSVELTVDGLVDPVPAGVDLSAYRIVQEALTNTLKHGGPGSHAAMAVARRGAALEGGRHRRRRRLGATGGGWRCRQRSRAGGHARAGGASRRRAAHRLGRRRLRGAGLVPRRCPSRDGRSVTESDRGPRPSSAAANLRVVIVDDQSLVRTGLRLILESEPGIEVVGEAGDGREAIEVVRRQRPAVVLMDIQMPVLDGLEATRAMTAEGVRVVSLATFERDDYILEAIRAGASGFLLKNAPPEELVAAVRVVAEGNALLSPSVTRRVLERLAGSTPEPGLAERLDELTEREVEVLRHVAAGRSNAEIAMALIVGEATVKTHVSRVLMKLALRDRVQAVVYAYECGLARPGGAPPTGPGSSGGGPPPRG